MKAMETVKLPAELATPAAGAIMGLLNRAGEGGGDLAALYVGGCVRSCILGLPVGDIDIATIHLPQEVVHLLEKEGIRTVPTGILHGTVTAVLEGTSFEITTLRKDVETDGRRAVIAYTDDWTTDARRRDFTMNTLLMDRQGRIYDPLGSGLDDLRAGRVLFVGAPEERIREDYLRILRFFRFHAVYGAGAPDPAALAACAREAAGIARLSRERVTQEFLKILSSDRAGFILKLMFSCNILAGLAHEDYDEKILERLAAIQHEYGLLDTEARLVALAGFTEAGLSRFRDGLSLSGAQLKKLAALLAACADVRATPPEGALCRPLYRYGREIVLQAILLTAARDGRDPGAAMKTAIARETPRFPVGGADLIALGIPPGKRLGAILAALEEEWLSRDCKPEKQELLTRLKTLT